MNNVFLDFVSLSPLIFVFSILIYTIGFIVNQLIKDNGIDANKSSLSKFTNQINLGFFISVILSAIFFTQGNTMLIIPALVLLFFGFYYNIFSLKHLKFNDIQFMKLLFFVIVFMLITLSMSALLEYDNRLLTQNDITYYARLSHNMSKFNLEKPLTDPLIISELSSSIYHYFNEWLTVIGLKILPNFSALKIFILFTLPCLTGVIFFNILSLTDKYLKTNSFLHKIFFSAFVLFMPSLINILFAFILNGSLETSYSSLHGGILFLKLKIVFLIMLISIRLYINSKLNFSLIVLSLVPFIWNTMIPAFFGATILLVIYQLICKKPVSKPVLITNVSSLFLLIFYLYFNLSDVEVVFKYSLTDYLKEEYANMEYVKKVILYFVAFSSILLLLFISKLRKYLDTHKLFVFFTLICSLLSYSLMHNLFNAKQIASNFVFPLVMIVLFFMLSWVFNKLPKLMKIVSLFSVVFIVSHTLLYADNSNKSDLYPIPKVFNTNASPFIATDLENKHRDPFNYFVRPYSFQMLDFKNWLPFRIDVFNNIPFDDKIDKLNFSGTTSNQSFVRFVSEKTNEFDKEQLSKYKAEFLKTYNFKYLLVHKSQFDSLSYLEQLNINSIDEFDEDVLILELD